MKFTVPINMTSRLTIILLLLLPVLLAFVPDKPRNSYFNVQISDLPAVRYSQHPAGWNTNMMWDGAK